MIQKKSEVEKFFFFILFSSRSHEFIFGSLAYQVDEMIFVRSFQQLKIFKVAIECFKNSIQSFSSLKPPTPLFILKLLRTYASGIKSYEIKRRLLLKQKVRFINFISFAEYRIPTRYWIWFHKKNIYFLFLGKIKFFSSAVEKVARAAVSYFLWLVLRLVF